MKTRAKPTLRQAIDFHGHLGPWLVIGLLMGDAALKRIGAKKHFGLDVKVWGASKRPKSCLIDGLQLSCGATYGKGNIKKFGGNAVKVNFRNTENKGSIDICLDETLAGVLDATKDHKANERLARKLYNSQPVKLFNIKKR